MGSLLEDQVLIVSEPKTIIDVGTQDGKTTLDYLTTFKDARVFGIEAEEANFAATHAAIKDHVGRCSIHNFALSQADGNAVFHINSHSGTHSLLPIGDSNYWAAPERELQTVAVKTRSLDSFTSEHAIDLVDILKMDIQGGELDALRGASSFLKASRIKLIACEVEFRPLYQGQPLFWDIARFLNDYNYSFFNLYDPFFSPKNTNILCWADAIFLSPEMTRITS